MSLPIGFEPRQDARPRAGGDDDMLRLIIALAQYAFGQRRLGLVRSLQWLADLDFAWLGQLRLAPDDIDLVLLEQEADAGIELRGDFSRTILDRFGIVADLALDPEAIVFGVLRVMEDFRRAQQSFGRDTAPVKADAAEMFALDDSRLQPELRGADRSDIAARPAADDDDVVWVGHSKCPIRSAAFQFYV